MPNIFHRKERKEKYNPCRDGHDYHEINSSTYTQKPIHGEEEIGGDGFEHEITVIKYKCSRCGDIYTEESSDRY